MTPADSRRPRVPSMSLSVYVVHFEAPGWCRETVRSLARSDHPVDITVVNNGGDLSGIDVRVVNMPDNVGYTGAANWAIADRPDEPYLMITSHDLTVEPTTVGRMVAAAKVHSDAGILGASVGSRGDVLLGQEEGIEWRDWTSGSCLLLRRRCLDDIGSFDQRLGSYGDDVDIALRANRAGWRVGRVLDARADHRGAAVGEARRERLIMTNRVLLASKHDSWSGVARMVTIGLARQMGYQLKLGLRAPSQLVHRLALMGNEATGAALGLWRLRSFRQSAFEDRSGPRWL